MVEQMGVDPRRLRRDIGTHPHGASGKLIDQLEGAQIEILAGAGQQRLEVFEHRRHDEFEAVTAEMVEQGPAQALDAFGLGRKGVGNVFG